MTNLTDPFDWKAAIAALPAPPLPAGFKQRDPNLPAEREVTAVRLARQIQELGDYRSMVTGLLGRLREIEGVPPAEIERLRELRDQAGKAQRQLLWRERNFLDPEDRKGVGVTLHLKSSEIAVLDWIARHLYYQNPIGPEDEPTNWVPSRAQAVRELIERYVERWGDRIPFDDLIETQEDWGRFWVREASWRRASVKKKVAGLVHPPRIPAL